MLLLISANLLLKQYQLSRNLRSQSKNLLSEIRVKSKTFGDRAFEKMAPKYGINSPKTLDPLQTLINLNSCERPTFLIIINYLILKFHNLSLIFTIHYYYYYCAPGVQGAPGAGADRRTHPGPGGDQDHLQPDPGHLRRPPPPQGRRPGAVGRLLGRQESRQDHRQTRELCWCTGAWKITMTSVCHEHSLKGLNR